MPISKDLYLHFALDITKERKIQDQLVQSEKMGAVGQLSAGIAHDVNNILAIIKSNSQIPSG